MILIVIAQLEPSVTSFFLHLGDKFHLLLERRFIENSVADINLTGDFLFAQSMVDNVEEALGPHDIIEGLREFCFSCITIFEF
jgi:hypothetical protein